MKTLAWRDSNLDGLFLSGCDATEPRSQAVDHPALCTCNATNSLACFQIKNFRHCKNILAYYIHRVAAVNAAISG
jgi:hypothetical protein